MKRLVLGLSFVIVMLGGRGTGLAQTEAPLPPDPADPASPTPPAAPAPGADTTPPEGSVSQTTPADKPGEAAKRTWQDVVVVPRKAFLKSGRLELYPFTGVSLNDVLIRHYSFGGELNYYLSDVFSIGLEGQYFVKERTDRESVVGLQYNRVATLNRYLYSGALQFGYVPGYGKFTLFNRYIIHWDFYVQAGVGLIQTEIIPARGGRRDVQEQQHRPQRGRRHAPVPQQLADLQRRAEGPRLQRQVRTDRPHAQQPIDTVKSNAESQFVHNVMLYAGIGLYLPTSFQYRTPR